MIARTFGRRAGGARLERIKASPNYHEGAFHNLEPTPMLAPGISYLSILKGMLSKSSDARPKKAFRFQAADLNKLDNNRDSLVWFGHSSYLLALKGFKILVDPVFSGYASPFSFMVKAFEGTDIYRPHDLPHIDLLLLTHDHFDHLDHRCVKALKNKVSKVVCPLGVGSHLIHWGYDPSTITELDWSEELRLGDIRLKALPARHFSGRTFKRNQTLWCSYSLARHDLKLFIGGDSGYDKHFKEIGDSEGRFDLALLECGQYNNFWPFIHMLPEQTVEAAMDLRASKFMPLHWGKFSLAYHGWKEPIELVTRAADFKGQGWVTVPIGSVYNIGEDKRIRWWENL